jgi:hypothetical protein
MYFIDDVRTLDLCQLTSVIIRDLFLLFRVFSILELNWFKVHLFREFKLTEMQQRQIWDERLGHQEPLFFLFLEMIDSILEQIFLVELVVVASYSFGYRLEFF